MSDPATNLPVEAETPRAHIAHALAGGDASPPDRG